jgi:hypothetical protein
VTGNIQPGIDSFCQTPVKKYLTVALFDRVWNAPARRQSVLTGRRRLGAGPRYLLAGPMPASEIVGLVSGSLASLQLAPPAMV